MSHEYVLSVTGKKYVLIFVIQLACRLAWGDVWLMHWVRSTAESNSHFHCAPGMGQLQRIPGHTYCWGFSFFFLPSCGPALGKPGSGQQPRCSGGGAHSLNIYSRTDAQGGDAASGLWPFIPVAGCMRVSCVQGGTCVGNARSVSLPAFGQRGACGAVPVFLCSGAVKDICPQTKISVLQTTWYKPL